MAVIRIGARGSELARRQAFEVQRAMGARGVACELVTFKTTGDKRTDVPLSQIGATGLFTKELERALAKGKVDCCVHSLKDLPTTASKGLEVAAVLEREDPRDVLVVSDGVEAEGIADLPRGSRVGTSSLRRRAQLLALRPDLEVVDLRGNVPTRLKKVDEGQVHAAILAAAGLHRLGVSQRIKQYLDAPAWLPAAGQGAIAVQIRKDDERMWVIARAMNHAATMIATRAERACLAGLEGGCQVPIGALALQTDGQLVLHAMLADADGTRVVRGSTSVDTAKPDLAGKRLAKELRKGGGEEILEGLRAAQDIPVPQPE